MNTKLAIISLAAVTMFTASSAFAGELYEENEDQSAPPAGSTSLKESFRTSVEASGELYEGADRALKNARGSDGVKEPYTTSLALDGELGSPKPNFYSPFGEDEIIAE